MAHTYPNFFIVGAPRSGTTSLYNYLREHPEVFMPDFKEPHFFASDIHGKWFIKDKTEYLSLFDEVQDETCIGEASTWYLYSKVAAENIFNFNPNAKIIIMLRDPLELMHSLYSHNLRKGNEDVHRFETALALESDRMEGRYAPSFPSFAEVVFYRDVVRFPQQIKRYLSTFPEKNVLIVLHEALKREPKQLYVDVCRFLCIDEGHLPNFDVYNVDRRPKHQLLYQAIFENAFIETCARLIPCEMKVKISKHLKRKMMEIHKRETIDPRLRSELLESLKPEIEDLNDLIVEDVTSWLRRE